MKFSRHLQSAYGPLVSVRPGDYTNRAAILGGLGTVVVDLIRALPKSGTFLDFGANAGIFSLIAAQHLDRGRVFAVEPNPVVFADLVRNIALNELSNIVPMNLTIGPETKAVGFAVDNWHTGAGHISGPGQASNSSILVLRAEEFRALLALDAAGPAFCKIDTEGAELLILSSLMQCGLLGSFSTYCVEIDAAHLQRLNATPDDIYDLMRANGFEARTGQRGQRHFDEVFVRI